VLTKRAFIEVPQQQSKTVVHSSLLVHFFMSIVVGGFTWIFEFVEGVWSAQPAAKTNATMSATKITFFICQLNGSSSIYSFSSAIFCSVQSGTSGVASWQV
jgi:hypothetical protein